MYTLQNVKDRYYTELAVGCIGVMKLEEYLRVLFNRVYDDELNFIGYEEKQYNFHRKFTSNKGELM